jgi:hypothetical protein
MPKRRKSTQRGSHYRALAEGYQALNPSVAGSFQSAAEYYDHSDPPLEMAAEPGGDERERKAVK